MSEEDPFRDAGVSGKKLVNGDGPVTGDGLIKREVASPGTMTESAAQQEPDKVPSAAVLSSPQDPEVPAERETKDDIAEASTAITPAPAKNEFIPEAMAPKNLDQGSKVARLSVTIPGSFE